MRRTTVASCLLALVVAACGDAAPRETQPNAEESPTSVQESSVSVTLADFVVEAEPSSVRAGPVMFDVRNDLGVHDLYVLQTDLPAGDLPEDAPGTLTRFDAGTGEVETVDLLERGPKLEPDVEVDKPDLTAPEIEVVGSIQPLEEGQIASVTLDLESGHYVLICNLVDFEFDKSDNVTEVGDSHFERGMRTDFSVEPQP